jgi:hypothetical protein
MGERLRSRPFALLGLLIAAGLLVPVLAQPAVACVGGHGQVFVSDFAGGIPPTDVPTIFYAGTEGASVTATMKPTASCAENETGSVRAHYVTETPGGSTASAGDFTDRDGISPVMCAAIHPVGGTPCEALPSQHQVSVPLTNDPDVESLAVEWFQFRLTQGEPAPGGNATGGLATPSQARIYVVDNDGGFRPAMEPGSEGATRNKGEFGQIRIPVFRAGPSPSLGNVSFTVTEHGTDPATPGQDFTCTPSCTGTGGSGTLSTFPEADSRLGFIQVNIVNDRDPEGNETLRVSVTGVAPADDEFTTVRIIDNESDDDPPLSRFHHPKDGLKYLRGDIRIREMHSITSDVGIAGLANVQIAVRQKRMNGSCRWWNGDIFAVRPCADRLWLDMHFVGEWNDFQDIYGHHFPALTPSVNTKIKNYTAWTRAIDTTDNVESLFQRGRNYSVFEVLRKRRR